MCTTNYYCFATAENIVSELYTFQTIIITSQDNLSAQLKQNNIRQKFQFSNKKLQSHCGGRSNYAKAMQFAPNHFHIPRRLFRTNVKKKVQIWDTLTYIVELCPNVRPFDM